jgi:hypothetical protein
MWWLSHCFLPLRNPSTMPLIGRENHTAIMHLVMKIRVQFLGLFWVMVHNTEYTQSGNGHFPAFIMMVHKIYPAWWGGGGGGALTLSTITCKVVVYAPAERAYPVTFPLFLLFPLLYSVVQIPSVV